MWPNQYTPERIRLAKLDSTNWETLYQGQPINATGSWCKEENIQINDPPRSTKDMVVRISVDLAYTKSAGDYTVIAVTGVDQQRNLHVIDMWRQQSTVNESLEALFSMVQRYPESVEVLIDRDTPSIMWKQTVQEQQRVRGINFYIGVEDIKNRSKEVRAIPLKGVLDSQRFFVNRADWTSALIAEFVGFLGGSIHDDIVDSISLPASKLNWTAGYKPPPKEPERMKVGMVMKEGKMYARANLNDMFENEERHQTLSASRRYKNRI
jgi:predicted phage terminase large subunit-like protein